MIKFTDGPAAGVVLQLRRAPLFLRVTRDFVGAWDALDQLDDTPHENEKLWCYERTSYGGRYHVRACRRSGFFEQATYRLLADLPPDEPTMRDTAAWQEWCLRRADATERQEPSGETPDEPPAASTAAPEADPAEHPKIKQARGNKPRTRW